MRLKEGDLLVEYYFGTEVFSKKFYIKRCECVRYFASYIEKENNCGCNITTNKKRYCHCCFKYFSANKYTGNYCSKTCYSLQRQANHAMLLRMVLLGLMNQENTEVMKKREQVNEKKLSEFIFSIYDEMQYMLNLDLNNITEVSNYAILFNFANWQIKNWVYEYKHNIKLSINDIQEKRMLEYRLEEFKKNNNIF